MRGVGGVVAVIVTVDMTFTHQAPDRGNVSYYFPGIDLPLPAEASDVAATSNGSAVSIDVDDTDVAEWDVLSVDFRATCSMASSGRSG